MSLIVGIATIGIQVITTIFMGVIFCVIKFNDLKHLDEKLSETNKKIETLYMFVHNLVEKVAKMEGRIGA